MALKKKETRSGQEADGTWLSPAKGGVVDGRIVRAFPWQGDRGWSAAYEIEGSYKKMLVGTGDAQKQGDGKGLLLLSERASYKDALRALKVGSRVVVTFVELVKLEGKLKGQTMWAATVEADEELADKDAPTCAASLKAQYLANTVGGDGVPF